MPIMKAQTMDEYPQLGRIAFGPPSSPRPVPVDPDAFKRDFGGSRTLFETYTNNIRASAWVSAVEAAAIEADGSFYDPQEDQITDPRLGAAIRALTPPEDLAPLIAARDARIREQALREAAEVFREGVNDDRSDREIEDAILGLIKHG